MNDFAATEKNGRFDFVTLFQKPDDVVLLEIVIVLIGIGSKLHFLDRDVSLMLLGFVKLLIELVKVFAVIHDSANRRICSRRNLDQIQTPLFSDLERCLRRHDTELLVLVVNYAYFASSDSLVHPYVFIDGLVLQNSQETNVKHNKADGVFQFVWLGNRGFPPIEMVKNVRLDMHELVSTSARIPQQKPSELRLIH
jgi:hypothetical protein